MSDYFSVVNGVQQGPVLFCVYIDDLLLLLKKSGFGCYMSAHFVGALVYADDIVFVAPSATALRKMLAICEDYADDFCICFNSTKFKCLVILPVCRRSLSNEFQSCIFYVAKKPIENVKFLHLGHSFTSEFNDDEDIINRRSNFVQHTNNSLCYFRKLHPFVQYIIFQAYCTSLYSCKLWLLTNCNIEVLCVAWQKTMCRIWNLPSCTHSRLLPLICNCLPLFDEIVIDYFILFALVLFTIRL